MYKVPISQRHLEGSLSVYGTLHYIRFVFLFFLLNLKIQIQVDKEPTPVNNGKQHIYAIEKCKKKHVKNAHIKKINNTPSHPLKSVLMNGQ